MVTKPTNPENYVIFCDGGLAALRDARFVYDTSLGHCVEFVLKPTKMLEWVYDMKGRGDAGYDPETLLYTKRYKVEYCDLLDASPTHTKWLIYRTWDGKEGETHQLALMDLRKKITQLSGDLMRAENLVLRLRNQLKGLTVGDRQLTNQFIQDMERLKNVVGTTTIAKGATYQGGDESGG